MTSPLSPEAVAQMVDDREAGTPGPWRMRVNKRDDQYTCDVSICGDIFVLADLNGPQYAHQHANARRIARLPDIEAAYLTLAAENATLRQHNDIRGQNMRDTWEAMQAMRDAINDHIPLPSTESDLLQGPENSVFCEVVATAVIGALATLRASEAAAMDRVTRLEAALQFYADTSGWNQPPVKTREGLFSIEYENQASKIQRDRGSVARQALTPTADKEPTT